MAITKIVDDMRTTVALDATKLAGNIDATQLTGTLPIADNSITLAHMASGTDGQVITYSAAGDPVAIGPGTTGQVLTSAGANLPQTFAAAAAGGAWELVSTRTPSGDASIIGTDINTTTNDVHALVIDSLIPAAAEGIFSLRLGDSSGIDSGGSDYAFHTQYCGSDGAGYQGTNSTGGAQIYLRTQVGGVTASRGVSGTVFIHKGPDNYPQVNGHFVSVSYTGVTHAGVVGGNRKAAITLDRYQLLFLNSVNIASGKIRLYKIANS